MFALNNVYFAPDVGNSSPPVPFSNNIVCAIDIASPH